MCLGDQFFFRNFPISVRRVGGRKKSKMSLIKTSLFMVGQKKGHILKEGRG